MRQEKKLATTNKTMSAFEDQAEGSGHNKGYKESERCTRRNQGRSVLGLHSTQGEDPSSSRYQNVPIEAENPAAAPARTTGLTRGTLIHYIIRKDILLFLLK